MARIDPYRQVNMNEPGERLILLWVGINTCIYERTQFQLRIFSPEPKYAEQIKNTQISYD